MTVLIEKSVCSDCGGKETCQRLNRLNPGKQIRDEQYEMHEKAKKGGLDSPDFFVKPYGECRERAIEVFEIQIVNCSMKKRYNKEIK
jgi:hypothetical protein